MVSAFVNAYKKAAWDGDIDWVNDTIKCALLDNTYTLDIDDHQYFAAVQAKETAATGYTAGGVALSSKTSVQDNTNNRGTIDCGPITFTGLTGTGIRYACVYKDTGNAATSPILFIWDLGSDQAPSAQDMILTPHADGVAYRS